MNFYHPNVIGMGIDNTVLLEIFNGKTKLHKKNMLDIIDAESVLIDDIEIKLSIFMNEDDNRFIMLFSDDKRVLMEAIITYNESDYPDIIKLKLLVSNYDLIYDFNNGNISVAEEDNINSTILPINKFTKSRFSISKYLIREYES